MVIVGMKAFQVNGFHCAHQARPVPKGDAFWPNVLMAIYGAAWCFTVPFVGQIYAAEAFALIMLPFLDIRGTLRTYSVLRRILIGYGVLLIGFMASDFVNDTDLLDFVRGWANVIFGAITLVFVSSCLRENSRSIIYFLAFLTLFKFILGDATYAIRDNIDLLTSDNPNYFKIKHVPYLVPAICLAGFYAQKIGRFYPALVFGLSAIIFIILDARSAGLALFIGSLIVAASVYKLRFSWSLLAVGAMPVLLVGQLIYVAYVDYTLKNNPFGQSGAQMSQISNPYNPLLLLLQGRSEWSVASSAITDKPIFGHGSWAIDYERKYAAFRAERTGSLESFYRKFESTNFLIPVHSVLLTGWIWGGVVGLLGVLIIFNQMVRLALLCFKKQESELFAIIAVFIPLFVWDFFFSPIQVLRLSFPQFFGLMIALSVIQFSGSTQFYRKQVRRDAKTAA